MEDLILAPITQYAFAGFCAVLLGIIVWLITQLLRVIDRNNQIISKLSETLTLNTTAVTSMHEESIRSHNSQMSATYKLRDSLLKLKCVADVDQFSD